MTNRANVIMAVASFYCAGFESMIEDDTQTANITSDQKINAPVSFSLLFFKQNQLKISIYVTEFLAVHFPIDMFATMLWGHEKTVLVLTDRRAITIFFQTIFFPPTLWKALDS